MPRLSIIVPHRSHDSQLEMTLLSLLENRPDDCEVIVVHNGSYSNPYHLEDEVIFVEEDPRTNTLQLLNAGIMAACSPAVCVLLDGVRVTPGWSDSPLETLLSSDLAAVAVRVDDSQRQKFSCGIDARLLRRTAAAQTGRIESSRENEACIGPVLACGFYRRKTLLSLGGWNDALDESVGDIEFALALHALGLECQFDSDAHVTSTVRRSRKMSTTALSQLSSLFVAHGAATAGLLPSLRSWVSDMLKGRFLSATAWSAGLRDASTIRRTQLRLNHAKQQLNSSADKAALRVYDGQSQLSSNQRRRAA